MNKQLTLSIRLNDEATLNNFFWGEQTLVRQQLEYSLLHQGERFIYLWGSPASGKSHILQACCQPNAGATSAMYLPMREVIHWGEDSLEGLEEQPLLAIDDIEAIAGNLAWEKALFHLYNRIRQQQQTILIISGCMSPANLPLTLPDLRSRLSWGLVMHLSNLKDEQKIQIIHELARQRGFSLPDSVSNYLLNHCSRDLHQLKKILDLLDEKSLTEKRKITIPFVKKTLNI